MGPIFSPKSGVGKPLGFAYYTVMLTLTKVFYYGILQRNYRKMTMKWSFFCKSFVNCPIITQFTYNMVYSYGPHGVIIEIITQRFGYRLKYQAKTHYRLESFSSRADNLVIA